MQWKTLKPFNSRGLQYSSFLGLCSQSESKTIQIFFRGTETGRKTDDLQRDLQFSLKGMAIPPLLKKIIEDNAEANKGSHLVGWDGKPIESIPIHRGFYGKCISDHYTQYANVVCLPAC